MDGVERTVDLRAITVSPELQIRRGSEGPGRITLRPDTVEEYRELIAQGADMGRLAVVDVQDTGSAGMLLLADGFHRLEAMRRLGRTQVDVIVYAGTQDDAVLLACELNARRGLTYTAADKRKVAERYLEALIHKQQHLSDNEIARRLGFSRRTIERARAELAERYDLPSTRQVMRGHQTYLMELRSPARSPAELEDLEDPDADEVIYVQTRGTPTHAGPHPYRPAPTRTENKGLRTEAPLSAQSFPHSPGPSSVLSPQSSGLLSIETVTFAIQWTYVDADGQTRIGATLHEAIAELPPVVRARVLRDLR